jgi:hypothetical protein
VLAGELSADSFCNPQNLRVKRLTGARSVVIGRTRPLLLLHSHSDAPSSGPSNETQRGNAERKSEGQVVVAERKDYSLDANTQIVSSGPAFARAAMSSPPRIPCHDEEAFCSRLALPAWQAPVGPATAGQGHKPRSGGAERVSLYRMALVRHPSPEAGKSFRPTSRSVFFKFATVAPRSDVGR